MAKKVVIIIDSNISEDLLAQIKQALGEDVEVILVDVNQLKEEKKELQSQIDDLEKVKSEQTQLINELMTVQQNLEKGLATGKSTIQDGDDIYEIVVPRFNYKDKEYDAASLRSDPELVKRLIKIKSNVLKKV